MNINGVSIPQLICMNSTIINIAQLIELSWLQVSISHCTSKLFFPSLFMKDSVSITVETFCYMVLVFSQTLPSRRILWPSWIYTVVEFSLWSSCKYAVIYQRILRWPKSFYIHHLLISGVCEFCNRIIPKIGLFQKGYFVIGLFQKDKSCMIQIRKQWLLIKHNTFNYEWFMTIQYSMTWKTSLVNDSRMFIISTVNLQESCVFNFCMANLSYGDKFA
jgi:hypothetical protein